MLSKHEEGKVRDNLWKEQHKFIEKGKCRNQIYRPSFIHVGRTGLFVKLSYARVTPLTSWAVIFFVFSPSVQHSIKARWRECLSVSLSVSLGEAMSSDYLLSSSIVDV